MKKIINDEIEKVRPYLPVQVDEELIYQVYERSIKIEEELFSDKGEKDQTEKKTDPVSETPAAALLEDPYEAPMPNKKRGVLLVNLGTPDSPHPSAVFRYLNEFLTDERVIDIPWIQRHLLVRGCIVPFRYRQSAKLYRRLWTEHGSPLLFHGRTDEKKLQEALGDSYSVVLAMRYQSPSIKEGLEKLKASRLTKSSFSLFFRNMHRAQPDLSIKK